MDKRITSHVVAEWNRMWDLECAMVREAADAVGPGCRFVEVGCGATGLLANRAELERLYSGSVGVDVDMEALEKNTQLMHRLRGSCYELPLQDRSVDIVVCRWLFEHLEAPSDAMREFSRVLKPGGFLFIKTPNLWNYGMQISRLTPTGFHNLVRSALGSGDNIRTFYRANTQRALQGLAGEHGFVVRHLESRSGSYMYYAFNKELFLLMRAISRCVGFATDKVQLALVCLCQKVAD